MKMTATAADAAATELLIVLVGEGVSEREDFRIPSSLDAVAGEIVRRDIQLTRFAGRWGEVLDVSLPAAAIPARLVLVGCGEQLDRARLARLGGRVLNELERLNARDAAVALAGAPVGALRCEDALSALATGLVMKGDRSFALRTRQPSVKTVLDQITFLVDESDVAACRAHLQKAEVIADCVKLTRRLVNTPPNYMTPSRLVAEAKELEAYGLGVDVLSGDENLKGKFPGLVAVGRGSAETSAVAILSWRGTASGAPVVAFSAKGVTFDGGGLTPKSESEQRLMKIDMAGAACAIAVMAAVARLRLPLNVVAAIGAVENLPGPHAYRPGDVITMGDGTTVEISFPDAEGRIVMGDLNAWLARHHAPEILVNLSTLTGTAVAALGEDCSALFSNNDVLARGLTEAAGEIGEAYWRLPIGERYVSLLNSDVADFKNMIAPGTFGILGGSASAAAEFLRHFAGDRQWASLDFLGPTWRSAPHDLGPAGATGRPVWALIRWLEKMAAFAVGSYFANPAEQKFHAA